MRETQCEKASGGDIVFKSVENFPMEALIGDAESLFYVVVLC